MQQQGDCQVVKMAGWAGFTDEDLMQIKQTTSPGPTSKQPVNAATKQPSMARKQKLLQQRELARQRAQEFAQSQTSDALLPSSHRLSQSTSEKTLPQGEKKFEADATVSVGKTDDKAATKACGAVETAKDSRNGDPRFDASDDVGENRSGPDVKELDEQEVVSLELSRMEQFRRQQQKMEEENKQRRKVLADAIKQRSKMAKEEAEKLTKVQKELNHLDSLVNADVAIIRDRIEAASIDFMQAQKRYERAEKEFVEAKLALVEKSDVKESLTEHLYTIIQQNEARKAERLAILMKELGLAAEQWPTTLTVPPLLSFSPINTLHRPGFPSSPTSAPTSPQAAAASPAAASGNSAEGPCQGEPGQVSPARTDDQGQKNQSSLQTEVTTNPQSVGSKLSNSGDGKSGDTANLTGDEQAKETGKGLDGRNEDGTKVEEQKQSSPTENGSLESQDGGADALVVAS